MRRTVVVVEDDPATRTVLAEQLALDGYLVEMAADGLAGLELILRRRPEVSLIDLSLPELDGLEVARRIRADPAGAGLRLIALSGYDRREDRARTRAAGFDEHAGKPIDWSALSRLIEGPA